MTAPQLTPSEVAAIEFVAENCLSVTPREALKSILADRRAMEEENSRLIERHVKMCCALDDALDHLRCDGQYCGMNINGIDYVCDPCELKRTIKQLLAAKGGEDG